MDGWTGVGDHITGVDGNRQCDTDQAVTRDDFH